MRTEDMTSCLRQVCSATTPERPVPLRPRPPEPHCWRHVHVHMRNFPTAGQRHVALAMATQSLSVSHAGCLDSADLRHISQLVYCHSTTVVQAAYLAHAGCLHSPAEVQSGLVLGQQPSCTPCAIDGLLPAAVSNKNEKGKSESQTPACARPKMQTACTWWL